MSQFRYGKHLLLLILAFATSAEASMAWSESENLHQGGYSDISINECNEAMMINVKSEGNDFPREAVVSNLYSENLQPELVCAPFEAAWMIDPKVAMNNSGHAIAAWAKYDANAFSLNVSKLVDGAWDAARAVYCTPHGAGNIVDLHLVANNLDQGVAIFTNQFEANDHLRAVVYNQGNWEEVQDVFSDSATNPSEIERIRESKVAINADGDMVIICVCEPFHRPVSVLKASQRKHNESDWSTPQVVAEISTDDGLIMNAEVAMNDKGAIMAVWAQSSRVKMATCWDGKWSEPLFISSEFEAWATSPKVAINNHGNALVIFQSNSALSARRRLNGIWGQPTQISQEGWVSSWSQQHQLVLNDSENALVAFNAYEDRELPPFVPPPEGLGFVVAFSDEKWDAPTQLLRSVFDISLNQKGQALLFGTDDGVLQVRRGQF